MLIFLDIETTGLNPAVHGILEIYAEVYDAKIPDGVMRIFHSYIIPDNYTWEAVVLRMHLNSGILAKCLAEGVALVAAMRAFVVWITSLSPIDRVTFAGKDVGRFDLSFLLAAEPTLSRYAHHNTLDMGSLLWKPSPTMQVLSLAKLCEAHNLPPQTHTASADVAACIALFREHFMKDDLR